jgi:phosphoribosylglycinamide formyltransferase 1
MQAEDFSGAKRANDPSSTKAMAVGPGDAPLIKDDAKTARIAVFASGTGSNLQVLLDYKKTVPSWPVEVVLVVSDKPLCKAVARAHAAGVPVFAGDPKAFASRHDYERQILGELRQQQVDGIALAGYMRIVGDVLLSAYPGRIVNLHPSLLPAFPGKSAVADALEAGAPETGVTVHYIDSGIDTGPIIAQWRVAIPEGVTEETLLERIHKVEHQLYPVVIGQLASEWMDET